MKIELGKYQLEVKGNGDYALRRWPTRPRPAVVEKRQPPSLTIPLGKRDGYAYHLRVDVEGGYAKTRTLLPKEVLERSSSEQRIKAVEEKWQRLKKAAAGAVKDAVKEAITPNWTKGLIAFNTAVFLAGQFNPELVDKLAFTPDSFLFHSDWRHLIGNMIPLYIIGREAEKSVGGKTMLLTYLLGGMAGGASHMVNPIKLEEYGIGLPAGGIGASGAVMGLWGLSIINAVKERAFGKAVLLTTGAHLILNIDHGPMIDQLEHAIGFTTGLVTGAINSLFCRKPESKELALQQQRQTQKSSLATE